MTIKHHIIIITTISLVLILLITFHNDIKKIKTKEQDKNESVQATITEKEIQPEKGYVYKNLFLNYDFSDGLNNWSHDKDVSVIQDNEKYILELTGQEKELTRIWQTIPTVSGHVYRLSYKFKGDSMAFVFFRDVQDGTVKLFYPGPAENWKEFKNDFKSKKDGKYQVFFSSSKIKEKFYYSDVSVIDLNSKEKE